MKDGVYEYKALIKDEDGYICPKCKILGFINVYMPDLTTIEKCVKCDFVFKRYKTRQFLSKLSDEEINYRFPLRNEDIINAEKKGDTVIFEMLPKILLSEPHNE